MQQAFFDIEKIALLALDNANGMQQREANVLAKKVLDRRERKDLSKRGALDK
jgi:hypothetical protein